jgi:hypothetical protein
MSAAVVHDVRCYMSVWVGAEAERQMFVSSCMIPETQQRKWGKEILKTKIKILPKCGCSCYQCIYFVCGLFNDAVSSSNCIASNDKVINGQWIEKYTEQSGNVIIFGHCSVICLENWGNHRNPQPSTSLIQSRCTNHLAVTFVKNHISSSRLFTTDDRWTAVDQRSTNYSQCHLVTQA